MKSRLVPRRHKILALLGVAAFALGSIYALISFSEAVKDSQIAKSQTEAAQLLEERLRESVNIAKEQEAAESTDSNESPEAANKLRERTAKTKIIGVLEIPRISLKRVIAEGTTNETLNDPFSGVGHYNGTALPGEWGNFAITGHRNGNGGTFFDLDKVTKGDSIKVTTPERVWEYKVSETLIVNPDDNEVLLNRPDRRTITITTCHPKWSDKQRLIVIGYLD